MKTIIALGLIALIGLSSCSFETYTSQCPTYSHHNKTTKHGQKAQAKYHKKASKRHSLI